MCPGCRVHIASAAARDNSLSHPRALLGVTIQQLQYNSVVTMPMSYHPQRLPRFHCELSWTMDIIIFIISRIVSAGGHDGSWVSMWAMCGGQTRYGHNFSSDRCQSEINVTWEMNASTQPSPWTVSITGEQRLHPFEDKIDDTIHNLCPARYEALFCSICPIGVYSPLTRNLISIGSLVIIKSDGQSMAWQKTVVANHSN